MPQLLCNGERFNKAVYNEMHRTLRASSTNTVAIVPAYAGEDVAMQRMVQEFLHVSEGRGHSVCGVRLLFDSMHILIGDSNLYA